MAKVSLWETIIPPISLRRTATCAYRISLRRAFLSWFMTGITLGCVWATFAFIAVGKFSVSAGQPKHQLVVAALLPAQIFPGSPNLTDKAFVDRSSSKERIIVDFCLPVFFYQLCTFVSLSALLTLVAIYPIAAQSRKGFNNPPARKAIISNSACVASKVVCSSSGAFLWPYLIAAGLGVLIESLPGRFEDIGVVRYVPVILISSPMQLAVLWWAVMAGLCGTRIVEHQQRARCINCGYDLRGTPGDRCSECGMELLQLP